MISGRTKWYNIGMKIKKPNDGGGATIADRFKLEVVTAGASSGTGVSKGAVAAAFGAALVSLALVGGLAAMLYTHLEYLKNV